MEQRPQEPIKLTPEIKAMFDQAFVDDVDTWSVGKLRAFLQSNGIAAQKLKKGIMQLQVKRIMMDRVKPINWNQ